MTGLLFPGQGTQRVGTGQALMRGFPDQVMPVIDEAATHCADLAALLRRGPPARLVHTQNAQLAVTAVNLGALAVVRASGVDFDVVAGHSVGLLSALVAAGCLSAPAALRLAAERGALMGALPEGGAMASLSGVTVEIAEEIARRATFETALPVVVAIVNGPATVVLSGSRPAVQRAADEAYGDEDAVKVTWLTVSHAFHSPLMAPAVSAWHAIVAELKLRAPRVPVIADSSGEALTAVADVREHLAAQLTTAVRWDLVSERLVRDGERRFVEVGDSKTLRALARPYPELLVDSMAMTHTLACLRDHGRLPDPHRVAGYSPGLRAARRVTGSSGSTPVALVTGASRGIGAATAQLLAMRRMHVIVNFRARAEQAQSVVDGIVLAGGSAEFAQADVSDEDAVRLMVRDIKRAHGRVDVLVNNAGITRDGYAAMMSLQKWRDVFDTNLTGAFLCCREVAKVMLAQNGGAIVNVSSIAGLVGTAGQINYASAKAGLMGLTRSFAAEVGPRGIRVNTVVPGFVETDMLATIPANELERQLAMVPLGRCGTVAEIAAAVAWLAGPEASYVTGATLVADGGLSRR